MGTEILPEDLGSEVDKLKRQLQVVSKRISTMILENAPSYSARMKDVSEIQEDLDQALHVVERVRRLVCFLVGCIPASLMVGNHS